MSTMRSQSGAVNGKYTIISRDGLNAVQGKINEMEVQRNEAVRTRNPDSGYIYGAVAVVLRAVRVADPSGIPLTQLRVIASKAPSRKPFTGHQVDEIMRLVYAYMAPIQAQESGQPQGTPSTARPTQPHSSARQRLEHGRLK